MSKRERRRERRNAKRDLARRKRALGPTAWSREILHRRLTREAAREQEAREQQQAEKERERARETHSRHAAFVERQEQINGHVAGLVQQEQARSQHEALRDHEHSIRDADEPMTHVQWSPTSGHQ
jgi:hypothetical protein